ncbi:MAG TPA: DUF5916 domain-containing protein [Chitinophagales bacterium]|nr:DUF5916 domain-containing protein [Chitinophagales bacterium]
MKLASILSFLILFISDAFCTDKPTLQAIRAAGSPKIDGNLSDACWQNIPFVPTTITYAPEFGKPPSERSEIKVVYDNSAIYIGAYMYDDHPDQIKHQLSQRDDPGPLADNFIVGFDTYDDGINGYRFQVTAAGVQYDEKGSAQNQHDASWDAVWESAASIKSDGWVCEIKIPYSAIRFPSSSPQDWGLQFGRNITRLGELDLWSPVDPKVSGIINQWGKLLGLENIKPPLRLSLSPYFTAGFQVSPTSSDPVAYSTDKILSGGADIKYGINESFTLDATLIPDFGQVQSDNLVLNISPFETKFDEKRPFFTEGTELFQQDNTSNGSNSPQLFYSRRIGGLPIHYYDVYSEVGNDETLKKNPSSSNLYNAIKFSGRSNSGLGIGILNAVSRPTFATIKNDETGTERKFETNPLTNYNVIVFDQTLKNNSKISFENTNVLRSGTDPDANVSSLHYDFRNKENSLQLVGFGNYSMHYSQDNNPNPLNGGYYQINVNEIKGKWTEWFWHEVITPHYDQNDFGILYFNNQMTNGIGGNYSNQEPKKGPFFNFNAYTNLNYKTRLQPLQYEEWEVSSGFNGNLKNYWNVGWNFYSKPFYYWDYYEPRVDTLRYHHYPIYVNSIWFGTDYRKKAYLFVNLTYGDAPGPHNPYYEIDLSPYFILSDKLNISYGISLSKDFGTWGFVTFDDFGNDIFGQRNTSTISNVITTKFIFNPKMNISFRARYYWSKVNYTRYQQLQQNGDLGHTDYTGNNDINFNVFNIDAVYAWEFAPGSFLNLIWKNNILQYDDLGVDNYFINCTKTFTSPQTNGVSLKVIYYLDYLSLKKRSS